MKMPSIAEFKQWARDVQPAAKAVLMARVFAQMERERVDAYVWPIFDSYRFEYGPIWTKHGGAPGLIPDPEHLYLADDTDPLLAAFYADCDKAHRDHGFTGPDGHCPALRAENLVMVAERALMELADPLFGIGTDIYGENRTKYLQLLIGACFAKDNPAERISA